MKKIVLIILMIPVLVLAQSTNQNYTKTTVYKSAGATNPVHEVNYFDGLGRPIQKIANAQSNSGKDIVTYFEYDAYGRQVKEFLPYANTAASLNYNPNAGTEVGPFYNTAQYENTLNPYSEKQFDDSPLNRVFKQAAPGNAWKLGSGHEVRLDYKTNTATEVKHFKATATWNETLELFDISISNPGDYAVNQLFKTVTKDENWVSGSNNTTEEFKNKDGKIVLKRTYDDITDIAKNLIESQAKHDTYYVYDQFGNLTYVIPPLANGSITNLNGLCYQYKYDYRNRLVAKKLPGKQWEYIMYDKLDRAVATGPVFSPKADGTLGLLITRYDQYSRPIETGWLQLSISDAERKSYQVSLNAGSNPFVLTANDILTKTYYDNYTFTGGPNPVPGTLPDSTYPIAQNVKGLATGTWVKVIDPANPNAFELSYTIYDNKYRPVRTYTKNHLGGFTQVDTNLDFSGKTNYNITTHKRLNSDVVITVKDMFTYSNQDRLLLHKQKINNNPEQLIAANTYNELGQIISKKVGGTDVTGTAALQKVDYTYNIRGWLKTINDLANFTDGTTVDLFAYKLNYNDATTTMDLFNGNISETFWRTKNDNVLRKYSYNYDKLNRLLDAVYEKPETATPITNSYDEHLQYDKNGNITALTRTGEYDDPVYELTMDNLTYSYDTNNPNQLNKVFDSTNSWKGFDDDSDGISDPDNDYSYDANGNLIKDDNKGITLIQYNHLNLPVKIVFDNNEETKIEYIYNALGQKAAKTVYKYLPQINSNLIPTTEKTEYLSGFQYFVELLTFFPHAEGFVKTFGDGVNGYEFYYAFNYKDHLGNVRLTYGMDPATNTVKIMEENNYYPFGLKHNNYNMNQKGYLKFGINKPYINSCEDCNGYRYKFIGQEFQDELGLNVYDFDNRVYDPAVGRFWEMDPLAENGRRWSPYNYCFDNPVYFQDPDGMWPIPGWVKSYAQGAWGAGKNLIVGAATGAYTNVRNGVNATKQVYNAYQQGGARAAVKEYGNQVYQTSGAKNLVETAVKAAKGDPKAIGATVTNVIAFAVARKAGKGSGGTATAAEAGEAAAAPKSTGSITNSVMAEAKRVHPEVNTTTLEPGANAGSSIPARSTSQSFTAAERQAINEIGSTEGCHTCGATESGRASGNFTPDHQPVSALVPEGTPQNLYPQCQGCSSSQGGTVSALKKKGYDTNNVSH